MIEVEHLPIHVVDTIITSLANKEYGDLSKYGIHRPKKGPFDIELATGRSSVLYVGTIRKIKEGSIKLLTTML